MILFGSDSVDKGWIVWLVGFNAHSHTNSLEYHEYFPSGLQQQHLWATPNTLRPKQNGCLFADDTFKRIFLNENVRISIKISLKFVLKVPINNIPALFQKMARRRPGDKPLSETMMVTLLTHICVTRPQWVKQQLTDLLTCDVLINAIRVDKVSLKRFDKETIMHNFPITWCPKTPFSHFSPLPTTVSSSTVMQRGQEMNIIVDILWCILLSILFYVSEILLCPLIHNAFISISGRL